MKEVIPTNKKNGPENQGRREFLKKLGILGAATTILGPKELFSQSQNTQEKIKRTEFVKTNEQFKNKEFVYKFVNEGGEQLGEFWPIHGINLVTKQTDPELFEGDITEIPQKLGGVATAPDGMTSGSLGSYIMEGKSLSNGRECGDGEIKNYGIIVVKKGFDITFTHKQEHLDDFDELYNKTKDEKGTLFFLPSIYRNNKFLPSTNMIDKVIIRREVPKGSGTTEKVQQIGVILFNNMITVDDARTAILGLDRGDGTISKTTHIYVLDGGNSWGQSAKEVNGEVKIKGDRDPTVVTNYLVFY